MLNAIKNIFIKPKEQEIVLEEPIKQDLPKGYKILIKHLMEGSYSISEDKKYMHFCNFNVHIFQDEQGNFGLRIRHILSEQFSDPIKLDLESLYKHDLILVEYIAEKLQYLLEFNDGAF